MNPEFFFIGIIRYYLCLRADSEMRGQSVQIEHLHHNKIVV